ncbi:MAG: site-2 protease family protein [Anaerolineales bacterium]|jgi:Zn-dependent protease/CBS domain-containing protein
MNQSLRLFTLRGIAVRMHITFPLILIWAALQFGLLAGGGWGGALFGMLATVILFGIVVLHEFGHSFAAQHYGIEVKQIVILPIGGVAQIAEIPEDPKKEFVIAIAGPAVNFILAAVLSGVLLVSGVDLRLSGLPDMLFNLQWMGIGALLGYVFAANLLLGLFNLLPAFPMDGGRILRAFLATRMAYPVATATAAGIGQGLAFLIGLWAFLRGDFFLVLIAIFIYSGANQERQMVVTRSILADFKVTDAYSRQAQSLAPGDSLQRAIDLTLAGFQSDFPVCDERGLVGMLTHTRLLDVLSRHGSNLPVEQAMETDFRPLHPDLPLVEAQRILAESRTDALPVIERGSFVGLLTQRDLTEVFRLAAFQPERRIVLETVEANL